MSTGVGEVEGLVRSLETARALHLDGHRTAGKGEVLAVDDPATGRPLVHLRGGSLVDADAAVDAADRAATAWSATPPRTRSEVLRRAFELIRAESGRLSLLISAESGKSLADAHAEVVYAAEFFRWFAEEAVRSDGGWATSPGGGTRTVVTSRPVGVAVLVTPWNFPAAMVTRKIAPALAAGCTTVVKPAAETPLTALVLADLLHRAGVPDGVVNVVPTADAAGVVSRWLQDPRVRKLSFTGSTAVGHALLRQAADRVVGCSMELGGNAPFVVTAGADVDAAVDGAMIAKFRSGGQSCVAANRFYVHASVADAFVDAFAARVKALRVGPALSAAGRDEGGEIGPLISASAAHRLTARVDSALASGARLAASSEPDRTGAEGYFVPARLIDHVDPTSPLVTEELFAPVAPVVRYDDERSLLEQVNGTEMGLAAYVYDADAGRALSLAERIEAGMVGVNRGLVSDPAAPFGGLKQSGLGREGAHEGMREFQETQYFSVAWS